MTGDIPAAALRLLSSLPVRTHERYSPETRARLRAYHKRTPDQRGDGTQARPLRYKGRTFKSITEAKTQLHMSPKTLYALLDSGLAVYL